MRARRSLIAVMVALVAVGLLARGWHAEHVRDLSGQHGRHPSFPIALLVTVGLAIFAGPLAKTRGGRL